MAANTTKVTDLPMEETGLPAEETIAETELDLMEGLLQAAAYKEDEGLRKEVAIRRNGGPVLFKFTVTPLGEEDMKRARKESRVMVNNPAGKRLPKVEKEIDFFRFKSWKIYLATIPEDREKIWDNKELKSRYNTMFGVDIVDVLLTAGEKSAINDLIDSISGYDVDELDLVDYAKN